MIYALVLLHFKWSKIEEIILATQKVRILLCPIRFLSLTLNTKNQHLDIKLILPYIDKKGAM